MKFDREEQLLLGGPVIDGEQSNQQVFSPPTPVDYGDGTLEDDFEYARKAAREAIHIALDVTKGAKELADSTNHPRMYEALNLSLSNLSAATKDLMHLHKQKNDAVAKLQQPPRNQTSIPGQTNIQMNDVTFVGSTSDLLRQIKNDEAAS